MKMKILFVLISALMLSSACSGGGGVDMEHPLAKQLAGKTFRITSSDLLGLAKNCATVPAEIQNLNINFWAKAFDAAGPADGDSDAGNTPGPILGSSSSISIYFDASGNFLIIQDDETILEGTWRPLSEDTVEATIEDDGEFYTIVARVDVDKGSLDMDLVEDQNGYECTEGYTTEGVSPQDAGNNGGQTQGGEVEPTSGGTESIGQPSVNISDQN